MAVRTNGGLHSAVQLLVEKLSELGVAHWVRSEYGKYAVVLSEPEELPRHIADEYGAEVALKVQKVMSLVRLQRPVSAIEDELGLSRAAVQRYVQIGDVPSLLRDGQRSLKITLPPLSSASV